MATFDLEKIKKAKEAGYSDADIASRLASRLNKPEIEKAVSSGQSVLAAADSLNRLEAAPGYTPWSPPGSFKGGPTLSPQFGYKAASSEFISPEKPNPVMSYLSQASEWATKDIPDIDRKYTDEWRKSSQLIGQPTWAGNALGLSYKPLVIDGQEYDTRSTLGKLAEGVVSAPERAARTALGAAKFGANEFINMPIDIAGSAVNRLGAGIPGKVLQKVVGPIAGSVIGAKEKLAQTGPGKVLMPPLPEDPASRANIEALKGGTEAALTVATPPGTGKAMTIASKVPVAAGMKFGVERAVAQMLPTTPEDAMSIISKNKTPKEQIKDAANLLAKYNLQGKVGDPRNALQSKALNMAYLRAQSAKEKIIKSEIDQGDLFNPINEINRDMIRFIYKDIKVAKRNEALKAYEKIKENLAGSGYNSDLSIRDVANMKEDLVVNWRKGVEPDPLENVKVQLEKKMYHQLNDVIKKNAPDAYKDAHEASELFSIADMARNAAKPDKKSGIIKLGGGAGILVGGGGVMKDISQAIANQMAPDLTMGQLALPVAVGTGLGYLAQQSVKPPSMSKLVTVGRGMQDLGELTQLRKPISRPGTGGYEKALEKSVNPKNKLLFDFENNKRLYQNFLERGDAEQADIFKESMIESMDEIQKQVFKKGTPSQKLVAEKYKFTDPSTFKALTDTYERMVGAEKQMEDRFGIVAGAGEKRKNAERLNKQFGRRP